MKLNQPIIDHHMSKAIKAGIFPGASLLVACQHEILHCGYYGRQQLSGKPVDSLTIYDLASLTKPLATSLALMHMLQAGILQLDQKLSTIFPECAESDKGNITVLQLLCHQSGLPAHRPYFEKLIHCPPKNRSNQLLSMIFDEPLIYQSGTKTIYSDLGFMVLNAAIERLNGFRLDTYIYNNIYHPLGVKDLFFIDLFNPSDLCKTRFAATEHCPWRKKMLVAEVHDDNAHVTGGVGGHAGLFGTIMAVYQLLDTLSGIYHNDSQLLVGPSIIQRKWIQTFFQVPNCAERPLGFDIPTPPSSSSGRYFSANSVGHLGFTGTSFWMDLKQKIVVILLTNRVHPSRHNNRIRSFRPLIHDIIMQDLIK